MRDAPRSSEPEVETLPEGVHPLGPARARGPRLRRWLRSSAYFASTTAALVAGDAFGGTRGLVIAGVLIVVATPVVGYTFSQIALSNKGRELATTVADVRSLMESSAAAFTLPFAAILRGLLTGQVNLAHTTPVSPEPGQELELKPPAPVDVWRDNAPGANMSDQSRPTGSAAPTFWPSLTTAEQEAHEACAQRNDPLTEDRRSLLSDELGESRSWNGHNCSIFLVDITAFGRRDRNDDDRRTIRNAMYTILQEACENSDVPWLACHREDRGDGALIIVPPSTPTRSVVDPLLARLAAALKHYNRQATPATRIQLRVALHVGPVVSEPQGVSGEAIILASRIIEAAKLKKELARTDAHLGVIVSAFVYESVIKHAPGYVDPNQYRQLRFRVKESNLAAWMSLVA